MPRSLFLLSLACSAMLSCNDKRADTSVLKDEMEDRRIMRITPGQVSEIAYLRGRNYIRIIDSLLTMKLTDSIKKSGEMATWNQCNEQRIAQKDTLEKLYEVSIARHTRQESAKEPKEWEVCDADLYNAENRIKSEENLQKLGDTVLLFTRPILLEKDLCLKCHGENNQQAIKKEDKITNDKSLFGLKEGSLMGIWAVRFHKKKLIKSITLKDLKKLEG